MDSSCTVYRVAITNQPLQLHLQYTKTAIKLNAEGEFANKPVVYSCLVCIIKVRAVYGT